MIAFFLRTAVKMLVLSAVLYGTFFVPLGRYTLYGHLSRIAGTNEAQELRGEVSGALEEATEGVGEQVGRLSDKVQD